MKKIKISGLAFLVLAFVFSCTKEKIVPTAAETNASILAGAKGSSKIWKIATISETKNGYSLGSIPSTDPSFPACESDNIFQFSNNASQDYQVSEGAINCNPSSDPDIIEKGGWALSIDGKTLVIDGAVYPTSTQFQDAGEPWLGYMILAEGVPLKVIQLTDANLTVSYSFTTNAGDTYVVTLAFKKG